MERARALRTGFLVAVPAVTGAVLLAHPDDPQRGGVVQGLGDVTTRWLAVHVGLLLLLPLLALWVWIALAGIRTLAARLARVAAVVFAALYSSFDALVGIGTGVLVREAVALGDPAAFALAERWWEVPAPIWVFSTLGPLSWVVAAGAAGLAHLRAGSGWIVAAPVALAGPLFGFGHPLLTGPIGMLLLAFAAVALARNPPPNGRTFP